MMPDDSLSTQPVVGSMLPPRNLPPSDMESFDYGGIALSDASKGLLYQVWRGYFDDAGQVFLEAPNTSPLLQFIAEGIEEISITFDQNMHPFIAYVQNGQAKFWWFDATVNEFVTTTMDAGVRSPKCVLDDKRPQATSTSDIILAYIRDDNLYFRQQRDRYEDEHLLMADLSTKFLNARVANIGMSTRFRLQFLLRANFFG